MLSAVTLPPLPSPLEPSAPEADAGAPPAGDAWQRPRHLEPAIRAGLRSGLFAAAATAGAIAGFSLREPGGVLAPFATTGRMLLGVAAGEARSAQLSALVAGLALHAAIVVGWSLLFALLTRARRGVRLWIGAALLAAVVYAASEFVLPPLLRLGHGAHPYPAQLALLYAVLAIALVLGMRLALLEGAGDVRARAPGE